MATETGGAAFRLAELEAVLTPLMPALERLQQAQREQRQVVVTGDLGAIVVTTTVIEESSARIALLEGRRQVIQNDLEAELGVQGLRSVLQAADIAPSERVRLGQMLTKIARLVRELREQGARNAELLSAAIDVAHRTRRIVERRSGADSIYDPVKARRQLAARRGYAGFTNPASTELRGQRPAQSDQDGTPESPAH
ncbi:MAG: flagellar export chaperone FlgN [Chloroflexi bacterium]|nr:flagellar export chaperone FlgN [Chloroflexota bacterium]